MDDHRDIAGVTGSLPDGTTPTHDWYEIRQALIDAGMAEGVQPVGERDVTEILKRHGTPAPSDPQFWMLWQGAYFNPDKWNDVK